LSIESLNTRFYSRSVSGN